MARRTGRGRRATRRRRPRRPPLRGRRPPRARRQPRALAVSTSATARGASPRAHFTRGGQGQPRPPQQHVADRPRLLVTGRVGDLGEQVRHPRLDRRGQVRPLRRHPQDLVGGVAVAAGELGVGLVRHARDTRELARLDRHAERHLVRHAGGVAPLALDDPVDGHLRHPPPRGQLAAGDRHHPARGLVQLGLARDVDRLARVARRDQRPHPGVGAGDVAGSERAREERVDRVEQIRHVVRRRPDPLEVAFVVVVGGADQRLPEPRQHEDRAAAAGGGDRARHHRQRRSRHDDVRAAAGPDDRDLGLVVQLLGPQPVRPHAGRVDHVVGPDLQLGAGLGVDHPRPAGAAAVLEQRDGLEPVGDHRAEARGFGDHGQHQPHVVRLAVVEQVAAGRPAGGQRRQQLDHLVAGDRAMARGAPVLVVAPAPPDRGHDVVHVQPDAGQPVRAGAVEGRHHERERPHEVRGERDVELALEQRLAHQPEIEVLQVAQAAVDELARARGGPDRVVRALDQRDRVAARGGVERDAGTRDPAADHEHVERLGGKRGDGVGAGEHLPTGH